jgi:hypothetical protein
LVVAGIERAHSEPPAEESGGLETVNDPWLFDDRLLELLASPTVHDQR